jgi:hypothetical protein
MQIITSQTPEAGTRFNFGVEHADPQFKDPISVEIYIAGQLVSHAGCKDPPCHRMYYLIPLGAQREELRIVATSVQGVATFVMSIGDPSPPRGLASAA